MAFGIKAKISPCRRFGEAAIQRGLGALLTIPPKEAIQFADESPLPGLEEIYEDVYVDYPLELMRRGINLEV